MISTAGNDITASSAFRKWCTVLHHHGPLDVMKQRILRLAELAPNALVIRGNGFSF